MLDLVAPTPALPWTTRLLVIAYSPTLWPIICGLISTGMNSFPEWTCIVSPTISGSMTASLTCVFMGLGSLPSLICFLTFLMRVSKDVCCGVGPLCPRDLLCLLGSSFMISSMLIFSSSCIVCPLYVNSLGMSFPSPMVCPGSLS